MIQLHRNAERDSSRSTNQSTVSAADEMIMTRGSNVVENHIIPKKNEPRWCLARGRNHTPLYRRVTCTLPRAQRRRCFQSPPMSAGSSAHTVALGSKTTERPRIWVSKVVKVS